MEASLRFSGKVENVQIKISGSKSETNRLLILKALFPEITLKNISNSDDSQHLIDALNSKSAIIDIGHAGTSMRFLTAYFSISTNRTVTLTGSGRMKERPIKILVDALTELGAEIEYLENEGYPPIKIFGKELTKAKIAINSNVSSQYITALLLIAPKLKNGLEIELLGQTTSQPYINMTLDLLREFGVSIIDEGKIIRILPFKIIHPVDIVIESDWSSASYFYSIVALSKAGAQLRLSSFKKLSLQGDSALVGIYKDFGVETSFGNNTITLTKTGSQPSSARYNLNDTPDLAQTIAVTCIALGVSCHLEGLQTLNIKETNRLIALRNELTKLGAEVTITDSALKFDAVEQINNDVIISTYDDHRMAMSFAALAVRTPITIKNAEVVSKSYPDFWRDLEKTGIIVEKLV